MLAQAGAGFLAALLLLGGLSAWRHSEKMGKTEATVTATNERGTKGESSFKVGMEPKPGPPTITQIANQTLEEGQSANLMLGVKVDPRLKLESVKLVAVADKPKVLGVSAKPGADGDWHLDLTAKKEGETTVAVTATDERGSTNQTSFKVTVLAQPPPPSIDPLGAQNWSSASLPRLSPWGSR
jgi:hypothetical protein